MVCGRRRNGDGRFDRIWTLRCCSPDHIVEGRFVRILRFCQGGRGLYRLLFGFDCGFNRVVLALGLLVFNLSVRGILFIFLRSILFL